MSEEEKRQYMVENRQTVRLFMDENGIRENYHIGRLNEKPRRVIASVLFSKYVEWCEQRGYDHEEFNGFSRIMTRYGVDRQKTNVGTVYALFLDRELDYFINEK